MKKVIMAAFMALTTLGFTACSGSDDDSTPITPSFQQTSYTLDNQEGATVVVTINSATAAEEATVVPITFSGAEEGVDFSSSASEFTFAKGATSASITLTRMAVGEPKTLTVNLGKASGVKLGTVNYATVQLVGANIYSFTTDYDVLTIQREYKVTLETADGNAFSFATATEVPIEIADGTTATLGEHFEFVNGQVAVFEAGKSTGVITLKTLKVEEGKNTLKLKVASSAGYLAGNYGTLTLEIAGATNFTGNWTFKEVSNAEWWSTSWYMNILNLIDGTTDDTFSMTEKDDVITFTPNFTGKLKNYFTAAGKATADGTRDEYLQEEGGFPPPTVTLYLYNIENINEYISDTDQSIGTHQVGFYMTTDDETGEELLVMTIADYHPTITTAYDGDMASWSDVYDMMAYSGDTPVMKTAPIRIQFTRSAE